MKRFVFLTGLLSAAAMAQPAGVISVRLLGDLTKDTYTYGAAGCSSTISLAWNNLSNVSFVQCPSNGLKIWASETSCTTTPGTNDKSYDTVAALLLATPPRSGSFTVKLSELPGHVNTVDADGGVTVNCPFATATTKTQYICAAYDYAIISGFGCGTATTVQANGFKFVYDTLPPAPPTIVSASAQDKAATIEFTADSDTVTVTVEVKGPSDADFRVAGTAIVVNTKQVRATGLANNTTYDLRLRGVDGAGNESNPSPITSVTPILTQGLLGYYASQNGELEGGCSSSAGLMPLLLVAWALRSRIRRAKGNTSR